MSAQPLQYEQRGMYISMFHQDFKPIPEDAYSTTYVSIWKGVLEYTQSMEKKEKLFNTHYMGQRQKLFNRHSIKQRDRNSLIQSAQIIHERRF